MSRGWGCEEVKVVVVKPIVALQKDLAWMRGALRQSENAKYGKTSASNGAANDIVDQESGMGVLYLVNIFLGRKPEGFGVEHTVSDTKAFTRSSFIPTDEEFTAAVSNGVPALLQRWLSCGFSFLFVVICVFLSCFLNFQFQIPKLLISIF